MPLKPGSNIRLGGRYLAEQRPELAALLGALACESAQIEDSIAALYATLLGGSLPLEIRGRFNIEAAGFAVFEAVQHIGRRITLLNELATIRVRDPDLRADLQAATKDVADAFTTRNFFLHSIGERPEGIPALQADAIQRCV